MRSSAALVCLLGCINNPVPAQRTLPAEQLQTWTHGLWIVVEPHGGQPFAGELLSAEADGVNVLVEGRVVGVTLAGAERMTVAAYRSEGTGIAVWGALVTLGTLTHGKFLFLSAPIAAVTWWVTQKGVHDRPVVQWPREPLDKLRPYARFPQGMPPGFAPDADRPPPWPE